MKKGLLSILVSVYQVEAYLEKCVDSLLRQTVSLEIWLVDDGSTDGSGAICDAYKERDVRIHVIHKENGGLASARLAGIHAAQGEYLAFVDSDDWVDDDLFERLLAPMLREERIDSSMGGYVMETEDGRQQGIPFLSEAAVLSAHEAGHCMFTSQGFNWSLWGKIYRASLFQEAVFLKRWPHSYGEDTFINYHLLRQMKSVAYVPGQGYHYRVRTTSMMHQPYDSARMAYFEIYDEILMDADSWDPQLVDDILQVAVTTCLPMRARLLETGDCPQDAERMRRYFEKWFPRMDTHWTPGLRWQWEYAATIPLGDYQARRERWKEELRQFAKSAQYLYLYGTGTYGTAFADWLNALGISWQGALETVPHRKEFCGHPVFAPHEVAGQDVAVLVAMNEPHAREVFPILQQHGLTNVLEGWKMMYGG